MLDGSHPVEDRGSGAESLSEGSKGERLDPTQPQAGWLLMAAPPPCVSDSLRSSSSSYRARARARLGVAVDLEGDIGYLIQI